MYIETCVRMLLALLCCGQAARSDKDEAMTPVDDTGYLSGLIEVRERDEYR